MFALSRFANAWLERMQNDGKVKAPNSRLLRVSADSRHALVTEFLPMTKRLPATPHGGLRGRTTQPAPCRHRWRVAETPRVSSAGEAL